MNPAEFDDPVAESYSNRGARWAIFTILAMLYQVAPLLIIPLWAYHVGNWWLLAGIAASFVGSAEAGQYSRATLLFGCYCIGFWIHYGFSIYHYTTFYFFCASWGYMLWNLAESVKSGHTLLVTSNIVREAFTYVCGLFTGLTRTAIAHARGLDNLTPEQADSIARTLTSGTMGFAMLLLGYFGVNSVYGYVFATAIVAIPLWAGVRYWRCRRDGKRDGTTI